MRLRGTPAGRTLVVSVHDVAPSTAEGSRRWVELLEDRGIRASLLVVPGPWNGFDIDSSPAFVEWLAAAAERGHEVVVHGFSHVNQDAMETSSARALIGRIMARGCEEFWHLSYQRAHDLLSTGRGMLQAHGFAPNGFVAPGWLMSPDAVDAARDLGFDYTCTHTSVIDLANGQTIPALTTSQRPRSVLSHAGVLVNQAMVAVTERAYSVGRVAIHPADLWIPKLRDSNLALCESLVAAGFEPLPYGELIAQRRGMDAHPSSGLRTAR